MFLDSLKCNNPGRPPIWLMRQAGRYLPEYQKIRANHTLLSLFHNPKLIVEITKQPIDILGVDAAILFSDILTVLDGLGVPYDFQPGPVVAFQGFDLQTNAYGHIEESIKQLKSELQVPLIGFAGGPITILSYMIDNFKKVMICEPERFDALFNTVLEETIRYLKIQEAAGVDCIQIFDSWARTLSPPFFKKYVQEPLARVIATLDVPVILFCKGAASELLESKPAALSVDWTFDLPTLRKQTKIALQGNLDPTILYGSKETIREHTEALLRSMRGDPGFIFNLGHGMLPDIPVDNVRTLIETVKASATLYQLSDRP